MKLSRGTTAQPEPFLLWEKRFDAGSGNHDHAGHRETQALAVPVLQTMTTALTQQVTPPLSRGVRKITSVRSACTLAALVFAGTLSAQSTDKPADATPVDEKVVELDKVVVKGFRVSLAQSLDEKRKANAIVDVITAEDIGKYPDTNLAESLSHLPGVTIDRLFGEGERVSILGTDPNLNRTLLNGQPIATADWYILDTPSRQFNYVLLAPEVIGKAEVYRSWESRLLEGSIGGTIIVSTVSPLKGPGCHRRSHRH